MASHVFTKRPGTTDRGHDFENYFIANLLLKLITDDDVEDFFLSSDDNDYGSFDDVVVEIVYRLGHRQTYAIQLKHLEERNLTVAALESDKGRFSIRSYFKNFNFQNDYTSIILYTNASSKVANGQVLSSYQQTSICENLSPSAMLTTSEKGKCYHLKTENSDENFRKFCEYFSLYANQANVTELKKQAHDLFEGLFQCKRSSAFNEYVQFISDWCQIEGEKNKLDKTWIRNVVATRILMPFVQPLSFSSRKVNENTKLLRGAITLFQTTVFDFGCNEKVRKLWSDFKQELTDVKKINMKYSVTSDFITSVEDLDGRDTESSIILWLLDKCPLILVDAPEIYRAIEVFHEKTFIVFNAKTNLQSKSVFEKLSDLENYEIYENVLNTFTCSLQGKENVTLRNLFHNCRDVGEILTTNELIQMVDGPLIITEGGMEVLPACHIPRRISKNVVNAKCLVQLKNDALILIDNFPNTTNLEKYGQFYVATIEEILGTKCNNKKKKVYLCGEKCLRADVEKLCRQTNKRNHYHFRHLNETLLEYISSSNINEIKYLLKREHYDQECELYQNDNDINIICANPGMGKTTLMKSLKNNIPSTLWAVLVYVRNYGSYFRKEKTSIHDFLNVCLIEVQKNISTFYQNVIRLLIHQKRIVILWDGLDEMVEENLEIVKKLIDDAQVQGYKQWVTSRNHLKSTLEDKFNTLSRSLDELDEKEQKTYIGERLHLDQKEVVDIFRKIQKNIALFPHNTILGIPLQSAMITELFLRDKDKYLNLLNEIFSLADLYEHFLDEKFNVYYKEKQNLGEINDVLWEGKEQDKELRVKCFEVAAIHTYFDKKVVDKLQIDSQNLSSRSKKDPVGFIINTTNDGLSEFCHNSFGEYFAALYLTKNRSDFFVTFDLLFEAKYDNIRLFYDLISAKGCKGHISVLYRNYELLTTCTDDEICKTDKFGRSTLEVACSWRKKYPLLQVTKDQLGKFEFQNELPLEKTNEIIELQKIISFLVTHFTSDQNRYDLILDQVLLLPFVSLEKDDFEKCRNIGDNCTISVLLYAVALDFVTILEFFEDIPFIYYTDDDHNLLTIILQHNSINCLKKVVFHEPYKIHISKKAYVLYNILSIFQNNSLFDIMADLIRDININISSGFLQYTLLHYACSDNNHEVASWLLKNGASINLTDKLGDLPLHVACRNGNYDVVKLLINEGSKCMEANKSGIVPLECAIDANSVKIVSYLLQRGVLVNHKNKSNDETFLHCACRKGFVAIAKLLLKNNAVINDADRYGKLPVHYASLSGNGKLLTLLIENGADINVKDKEGNTPLHLACESYQLTKILVDNGADLFVLNNDEKFVVQLTSDSKVLNLLIKSGVNLNSRDTKGRMLIHHVCSNKHDYSADFLDVLIENTSDINAIDNDGLAPLHHLCLNGVDSNLSENITGDNACSNLKKLLEKDETTTVSDSRTNKNKAGAVSQTKLQFHKSLHFDNNYENKTQCIEKLISHGANINSKDHSGRTPLHFACLPRKNGSAKLVEVLIRNGSHVNVTDDNEKTPLDYACAATEKYFDEIIKLLVRKGAAVNIRHRRVFRIIKQILYDNYISS